ncbi:MAG: indole-3-glycerol phosphate synthase TrpC [Dehalococcoidaceae bacterium]|nr:indole-3-glycerol phosphate synthase TrpC [Dehalococcoidaceae bacterium]
MLTEIVARKRAELAGLKQQVPLETVTRLAGDALPPRSLSQALEGRELKLIAEVKRASPSRGVIAGNLDAVELARAYAAGGAAAISVITEQNFFKGNIGYLSQIRRELGAERPPLVRKDFIFDEYQIYETRAMGGDSLLLIAAILEPGQLEGLIKLSYNLGLECLVEVHDEKDIHIALQAGAAIIGINNRDLNTFQVDIQTTVRLRPLIPEGRIVVSESGFKTRLDIEQIKGLDIAAVLVGEALVAAPSVAGCMEELLG